ncbi:MAG TPA: carbohydrate ABC transporter permease [Candidatus Aerophobetes bacterium]|uniref:Carbohydrate ABC transporter permease n=2 Tax=Aerophobetes bacterium TaxID=2030807 RepID=A0A7V0MZR6_UNCAE|nr:carbohydrate ABC transporter permease [Candidatus Aerophobetes bacterium]
MIQVSIRNIGKKLLIWIVLIIFAIWTVFPLIWAVATSFKTMTESYTLSIIPYLQFKPSWYAWNEIWGRMFGRVSKSLINSIVVAGLSSLFVLALGCLAGYALSRFVFEKWKNKDIATWILSLRMFPPVVVLIPIFLMMRTLYLLDTWRAIILVHMLYNLPLAVWLMMDFFNEIPEDIEESALIDGCSRFGAFVRISIPLSSSGLVAVYILSFIFSWSEFLFAVSLSYNKAITFPAMIAGALSVKGLDFARVSALTLLAITPPMILAVLMSKYLIRGLTFGAVKG